MKITPPQNQLERKWKLETAAVTELKREEGERRKEKGEGLNSMKTVGAQSLQFCSSIPGGALVGRANPQEQSGVWEVLRPHRRSGSTAERTFGRGCEATWAQQTPEMATFAGAGRRSLRVKPGARCVL